jgi:hypothetical protein
VACSETIVLTLGAGRVELSGGAPPIHGWIGDTSIERDHERFSGFLKLSLEELLIALRSDRSLLQDPNGIFSRSARGLKASTVSHFHCQS